MCLFDKSAKKCGKQKSKYNKILKIKSVRILIFKICIYLLGQKNIKLILYLGFRFEKNYKACHQIIFFYSFVL